MRSERIPDDDEVGEIPEGQEHYGRLPDGLTGFIHSPDVPLIEDPELDQFYLDHEEDLDNLDSRELQALVEMYRIRGDDAFINESIEH